LDQATTPAVAGVARTVKVTESGALTRSPSEFALTVTVVPAKLDEYSPPSVATGIPTDSISQEPGRLTRTHPSSPLSAVAVTEKFVVCPAVATGGETMIEYSVAAATSADGKLRARAAASAIRP